MNPLRDAMIASALAGALARLAPEPARPVHRVTPDSRLGRKMQQAKGAQLADNSRILPDVAAWNREVDRRRAEKKAKKGAKP